MSQRAFQDYFIDMFDYVGRLLRAKHGMKRGDIRNHEERLGIKAPEALIAYYRVAGNETEFNYCLDELVKPESWYINKNHLVFYEAHQAVVIYGIRCDELDRPDPQVHIRTMPGDSEWELISPSVSNFFHIMTYWQGVFAGALENIRWAKVESSLKKTLDRDWECLGELNEMWCYRRDGCVVCILKWEESWHIYAGGRTPEDENKIAKDLNVVWEPIG